MTSMTCSRSSKLSGNEGSAGWKPAASILGTQLWPTRDVFWTGAATAVVTAPVRVVEGLGHRHEMLAGDVAFHQHLRGELAAVRGCCDRDVLEPPPAQRALRLEDALQGAVDVGGDVQVEGAVTVGVEEGGPRVPSR